MQESICPQLKNFMMQGRSYYIGKNNMEDSIMYIHHRKLYTDVGFVTIKEEILEDRCKLIYMSATL